MLDTPRFQPLGSSSSRGVSAAAAVVGSSVMMMMKFFALLLLLRLLLLLSCFTWHLVTDVFLKATYISYRTIRYPYLDYFCIVHISIYDTLAERYRAACADNDGTPIAVTYCLINNKRRTKSIGAILLDS